MGLRSSMLNAIRFLQEESRGSGTTDRWAIAHRWSYCSGSFPSRQAMQQILRGWGCGGGECVLKRSLCTVLRPVHVFFDSFSEYVSAPLDNDACW